MSHVSAAQAQRLAYKDMNYGIYISCTLAMYGLIVLIAMLVPDIGTIIDFVCAYSVSCMAFFIPSVFYTRAIKKFGVDVKGPGVKTNLTIACIFIPLGILNFTLSITSALLSITGVTSSD